MLINASFLFFKLRLMVFFKKFLCNYIKHDVNDYADDIKNSIQNDKNSYIAT